MTHSKPSDAAIKNLSWTNPWLQLPDAFYQRIQLTPLDTPYFIHCNTHTAELLGLSAEQLQNEATLHFFNGQQLPPEVQPTASVYAGHQFGIFTAQLGDGRVLSLGEVVGHNDRRYEIQLKGAGLTLYSRTLDGRCPLGSAIREYLGSEGFTHGVINTDNMSVLGDMLDFGPFGFMETYHPEFLANASDDLGRYQFDQQPEIGRWNCLALAEAMSSLLPSRTIPAKLLRLYRQHYHQHYLQRLRLKLGLSTPHPDDAKLIEVLLTTLQQGNIDYALFFRNLADFINVQEKNPALYTLTTDSANLMQWLSLYQDRLRLETISSQERQKQMNQVNPCYVLRSHLLKQSITDAEHGDLTEFYRLLTLLQNPFEEQTGMDFYAQPYNPEAD